VQASLDQGFVVHHLELLAVGRDGYLIARHHAHHREHGARRLPALRASAGVIEGDLSADFHFDRISGAQAAQCSTGKAFCARTDAAVNGGMD